MKAHPLGHIEDNSKVLAFFGDDRSTPENLVGHFPGILFVYLQQTHSDTVLMADPQTSQTGDAHITSARGLALCVRTADCVPVLIHDADRGFIASIHAGWRGVENEIIRKTCSELRSLGCDLSQAHAWIGPHIGARSFEVGTDVANRLLAVFSRVQSFADKTTVLLPHSDSQKFFVDLLTIARAQLAAEGLRSEQQSVLPIDTLTSNQHCSFRRDASRAGRQVSFIVLK